MQYSDFLLKIMEKSIKIALNRQTKLKSIKVKDDPNQILTEADMEIGMFLIKKILAEFPNHNIIDEEAGIIDNQSDYTWVIDPIDGTSNYAAGTPLYGIMVGILKKNVPIAGVIALPAFREIYIAEKGKGAFCNGKRISVSKQKKLIDCLIAYGIDSNMKNPDLTLKEMKILAHIVLSIRNIRNSNSVFDTMMVASGKYAASLNMTSKIWDNVAPQVIIEEAGGVYTDFEGNSIDYSYPLTKFNNNFTFCAGSKIIHDNLQRIIHSRKILKEKE